MRERTLELVVGLFLLAGIFALVLLALRVSGLSVGGGQETYRVYAYFDNVAGLTTRAKVSMAGVNVGKVTAIELDEFVSKVTIELDKKVNYIPADSTASIMTAGLLGEKYISISQGGDAEVLENESIVYDTQSSLILEELIGKFLLNTVNSDKKD
ncbi:outer membrane lipid asymmetry maintenance protein MlaD [Pseudomonas sp. F1_0610]|uniref:outer membrane lipid asymmetry maintenance protein MlaD n=1 Tax=Pseudomonas sp. F1_0610 TaxID=3114284 RepID=UPI0039C287A3